MHGKSKTVKMAKKIKAREKAEKKKTFRVLFALIALIVIALVIAIFAVEVKKPRAEKPKPSEPFCGSSTEGACLSNSDCIQSGCSGQVCQSKQEARMITTCEWRDCFNASAYGLACRCVGRKCKWA